MMKKQEETKNQGKEDKNVSGRTSYL